MLRWSPILLSLMLALIAVATASGAAAAQDPYHAVTFRVTGPKTVTAGQIAKFSYVIKVDRSDPLQGQAADVEMYVDDHNPQARAIIKVVPVDPMRLHYSGPDGYVSWNLPSLGRGTHTYLVYVKIPAFQSAGLETNVSHTFCLNSFMSFIHSPFKDFDYGRRWYRCAKYAPH